MDKTNGFLNFHLFLLEPPRPPFFSADASELPFPLPLPLPPDFPGLLISVTSIPITSYIQIR